MRFRCNLCCFGIPVGGKRVGHDSDPSAIPDQRRLLYRHWGNALFTGGTLNVVAPGIYPITVIRGIAFAPLIFKCLDGTITVSGGLTDDGNGVYLPTDDFAGSAAWILNTPGPSPTFWLYFNPAHEKYVISEELSEGTLTDYWGRPDTGDEDEPAGGYLPHGAYVPFGTRNADETPVDLTGKDVEAQVRRTEKSNVYLIDLNPSITNAPAGEITLPGFSSDETWAFRVSDNNWDLVITDTATSQRFGPYVRGPYRIVDNITQLIH